MIKLIEELLTHPTFILIGAFTLIEIAPIKINPWKKLFQGIGDVMNGDIKKDLSELKRDFEETKAQDKRWYILNFANSCRNGMLHSKDEWRHVISEISEYETYTQKKGLVNGVIEEDSKYIRELYRERNIKNDFFVRKDDAT